ncbi:MAG TPA: outer membrane beta-barrel protein [Bradyrhizobium sp.]|nr:outer membrane beta-barrel protein [Bradyrhizobium sp.]
MIGATCAPVFPADLVKAPYVKAPAYDPPLYGWSGGYGGIEGGYGWGRSSQTDPGIPTPSPSPTPTPTPTPSPTPTPTPTATPPSADGHYAVNGGLVGGALGYNWQIGRWVYGVEGDYAWADINGQSNACGALTGTPHACGTSLNSLGTVRGRVGYAVGPRGNWLLYATGGLAFGDVRGWDSLTPASGNAWRAGWAAGAGVEVAFAPNWTAKLEYLYFDLGKAQLFDVVPGVPETVSFNADLIRAGIAYHFGSPVR